MLTKLRICMLSKQYCLSLVIVNTVKNVIVNKDIL